MPRASDGTDQDGGKVSGTVRSVNPTLGRPDRVTGSGWMRTQRRPRVSLRQSDVDGIGARGQVGGMTGRAGIGGGMCERSRSRQVNSRGRESAKLCQRRAAGRLQVQRRIDFALRLVGMGAQVVQGQGRLVAEKHGRADGQAGPLSPRIKAVG